jgi:hypothetical protein
VLGDIIMSYCGAGSLPLALFRRPSATVGSSVSLVHPQNKYHTEAPAAAAACRHPSKNIPACSRQKSMASDNSVKSLLARSMIDDGQTIHSFH